MASLSNNNKQAQVGLMLGQRLRRWPNIRPTSHQCLLQTYVTDYLISFVVQKY